MDFVAIDFETANEKRSSPCSVGVVVIRGGEAAVSYYTLIRPRECRFSQFNTCIHGITAEDVQDEPEFPEVWPGLKKLMDNGIVVAHNASFDMSVIRNTLAEYGLKSPEITYSCTRIISQAAWPGLCNYKLTTVAKKLGIEFKHHHALNDACACAEVARRACQETNSATLDDLADHLGLSHGQIFENGGYSPPSRRRAASCANASSRSSRIEIRAIRPSTNALEANHPFSGRTFVFTGALQSMTRNQATQIVEDLGGEVGKDVTKHTNYLVVGDDDYRKYTDGQTPHSKIRKAQALLTTGVDIEIISEQEFLQMLGL